MSTTPWEFEKYQRQHTSVPETAIMAMRSGLEARYADRFIKYQGTTDDYLKKADQARHTSEALRQAKGVVDTQKENIDDLFLLAESMVKMVDDFQRQSGVKQVKNVPLAGDTIRKSSGKQLGYVKLVMKFVNAGFLHFLEMTLDMKEDLRNKEKIIQAIAEDQVDIPVLGRLTDVDLDDLSSESPITESKLPLDNSSESSGPSRPSSAASTAVTGLSTPEQKKTPERPNDKSADKKSVATPSKPTSPAGKPQGLLNKSIKK